MPSMRYGSARLHTLMIGAVLLLSCVALRATEFRIVWVQIGDAASSDGVLPSRAGRHLFMAADVANLSLRQVTVARIEVTPSVTELAQGQRFCISSLSIAATDADHAPIKSAPLSVTVRQDHRDALGLERRDDDICVRPRAAGEYPVRFTSVLPAADGTARGAQIYLRVSAASGG